MRTRTDEGLSPGSSREDGEGLQTEQDSAVLGVRVGAAGYSFLPLDNRLQEEKFLKVKSKAPQSLSL